MANVDVTYMEVVSFHSNQSLEANRSASQEAKGKGNQHSICSHNVFFIKYL